MRTYSGEGGGMKGIYSLGVLSAIYEKYGNDYFDFFIGTSTNAIIAAGMAFGRSVAEMKDLYLSEAKVIFAQELKWKIKTQNGLGGPKYPIWGLTGALKEFFGEAKVTDAPKRFMVAGADTWNAQIILPDSSNPKWSTMAVWEAVLISAAAPTYFPSYQRLSIDYPGSLLNGIDGGVYAGDPSLLAMGEILKARKMRSPEENYQTIDELISVGTGYRTHRYNTQGYGALEWIVQNVTGDMDTPLINVFQDFNKMKDHYFLNLVAEVIPRFKFQTINRELTSKIKMDTTDRSHLEDMFDMGVEDGKKFLADPGRLYPNGTGATIPKN